MQLIFWSVQYSIVEAAKRFASILSEHMKTPEERFAYQKYIYKNSSGSKYRPRPARRLRDREIAY